MRLKVLFFLLIFQQIYSQEALLISKEANLYQVDEHFYRSEQLKPEDTLSFNQINVKNIINLRYFTRKSNDKLFNNKAINLMNYPLITWKVSPEQIAEVLHLILENKNKGGVLLHCYHGADRTGIVVAMYRILFQGFSIEKAKQEMQGEKFGYHKIWRNLDHLLTQEKVERVKNHLQLLKNNQKIN